MFFIQVFDFGSLAKMLVFIYSLLFWVMQLFWWFILSIGISSSLLVLLEADFDNWGPNLFFFYWFEKFYQFLENFRSCMFR